jgi:general secretion pathway protein K
MLKSILNNNRGIALILTLSIISILIAGALELNKNARNAVVSAATTRDQITLSQIASSGIHTGMAILIKDKYDSETDSVQEAWADAENLHTLLKSNTFDNGSMTLKISDELSRIQVNALVNFPESLNFNALQMQLWDRFLRHMITLNEHNENTDPVEIINAVKDWIDSGDDDAITGLSGAESGYYQNLEPPYSCKNGPIQNTEEFLMIKGITPDIFYGSKTAEGISAYITPYGINIAINIAKENKGFTFNGKININTAGFPVLAALLPEEHKDLAQNIFDYRIEASGSAYLHDLSKQAWYRAVPGCSNIIIDPELITTSSDFFRIVSTASLKDMKTTITAVVHREKEDKTGKWTCKILSWQHE